MDGWMAGWLDGWMAGWLDGWPTDEAIIKFCLFPFGFSCRKSLYFLFGIYYTAILFIDIKWCRGEYVLIQVHTKPFSWRFYSSHVLSSILL